MTFAALLLSTFGLKWARSPSLLPALLIGLVTVLAPFLVLQPAMGAGIASSKTPNAAFNRIRASSRTRYVGWVSISPLLQQRTFGFADGSGVPVPGVIVSPFGYSAALALGAFTALASL
jgi:Protein of unknown function (DUF2938)